MPMLCSSSLPCVFFLSQAAAAATGEVQVEVDQLVSKLEKEKDEAVADFKGMMEGNQDSATDLLNEADGVMDVVDKLFALCESWFGGAKAPPLKLKSDLISQSNNGLAILRHPCS